MPHSLLSETEPVSRDTRPSAACAGSERRKAALVLAILLPLLRLSRVCAQEENEVGYRKEFYREDDHRINVDTDTANFNVNLNSTVSLSGNVVMDAISGATPTGAPPQTKWPFPTYNDLFSRAFNQVYAGQFNQYLSDNVIYADAGYITYQQLTNDASAFAQSSASTIATNNANSSYQSLTNSPKFHRNTVPLVHMHDYRTAFSLQAPIVLGIQEITPSVSYSTESDYHSYGGALNYSVALNDKNTTLNAGYSHNSDRVRDDVFKWRDKDTDDILMGVVQLFSPKSYLTVNGTIGFERGYLADPYRGVMAEENFPQVNPKDAALFPERRPRHRNKQVLFVGWNQFFTPLNGAVEASYRFYHDTYGIFAHTVELDWHQKIGKRIVISPMVRYYEQNAADFYYVLVPDFNNLPPAYSADYRLSNLQSISGGVNITWRVQKHVSFDVGYLRYVMQGLDDVTSPSAYPSANVYTVGMRLWF